MNKTKAPVKQEQTVHEDEDSNQNHETHTQEYTEEGYKIVSKSPAETFKKFKAPDEYNKAPVDEDEHSDYDEPNQKAPIR